jgi:heat-inducible transcriptional repressor
MRKGSSLSDRNATILHLIVQAYIETGEPVASRSIAKRMRENLSPASIRNVMADLYEEGYLAQPHTSAGRVPTEKAFQSYVKSLMAHRIALDELQRIQSQLRESDTMEGRLEQSSRILMELTRGFGIVAAIPTGSQSLHSVDLLALGEKRVLMVMVTRDHVVRNRVVTLAENVTQDELNTIRNYLNANFSGWELTRIHYELEIRLRQQSAAYDALLMKLHLLYEKGLLELNLQPEIRMEGASNLVGLDLHLTREKMRELFRALEQKKRMLQLLERFLEHPEGEIGVQVGLADVHPAMGQLAIVGVNIHLPNGHAAKLAVLGPIRMNYERVMSAVLHTGQALGSTAV